MSDMNEAIETMNDMSTSAYDNLRKLGEMQMDTWNKMLERQLETFNLIIGGAVSHAELASGANDYQDMLKGQISVNQKLTEDLVEKTRESASFVQEIAEEYRSWAEDSVKQATDKLSSVAQKAA